MEQTEKLNHREPGKDKGGGESWGQQHHCSGRGGGRPPGAGNWPSSPAGRRGAGPGPAKEAGRGLGRNRCRVKEGIGEPLPWRAVSLAIVHLRDLSSSHHQLSNSFFPGLQSLQCIATQRERKTLLVVSIGPELPPTPCVCVPWAYNQGQWWERRRRGSRSKIGCPSGS